MAVQKKKGERMSLVMTFALVASTAAYASVPHPLLGGLLLATIGLVVLRSVIIARMQRVGRRLSRSCQALSHLNMAMQSERELPVLLHWELGLRKFLCLGCGQLPGTTVARRGELPLSEVEPKKASSYREEASDFLEFSKGSPTFRSLQWP